MYVTLLITLLRHVFRATITTLICCHYGHLFHFLSLPIYSRKRSRRPIECEYNKFRNRYLGIYNLFILGVRKQNKSRVQFVWCWWREVYWVNTQLVSPEVPSIVQTSETGSGQTTSHYPLTSNQTHRRQQSVSKTLKKFLT